MKTCMHLALPLTTLLAVGSSASAQRDGGPYSLYAEVPSGTQTRQTHGDAGHAIAGVSSPGQAMAAGKIYEIHASASARRALVLQTSLTPVPASLPEEQSADFTIDFSTDTRGSHAVPADDLTLVPLSGPLATGPEPWQLTASPVWQDTPASASGSFDILTATAHFTVLDTLKDNYGSYAGDGIHDRWQIDHFGFDNPLAAPGEDPDRDGHDNFKEFAFGADPNNSASAPLVIPRMLEDESGRFLAVLVRVRKGDESLFTAPAEAPPLDLAARAIRDGVRYTATGSTAPGSGISVSVSQMIPAPEFADIPPPDPDNHDVVLRFNTHTLNLPAGFFRMEAQVAEP